MEEVGVIEFLGPLRGDPQSAQCYDGEEEIVGLLDSSHTCECYEGNWTPRIPGARERELRGYV